MDNLELIKDLQNAMPESIAAIGYGSGVFKQIGYDKNEKPDKDIILVVEDFKQFLIDDYKMNPNHFSDDFNPNILYMKKEKNKFYNNLGCLKFYKDNIRFKLMIISKEALDFDLRTWKHFGMAGRLTKPILYDNIPEELETSIKKNRQNALITTLLYLKDRNITPNRFYKTLAKLTYMNDFRTILPGEKKTKSSDIVDGAFEEFHKIYKENEIINLEHEIAINNLPIEYINELPTNLKQAIYNGLKINHAYQITKNDAEKISNIIEKYIKDTNFINSIYLALSSSATLGAKESVRHGIAKVKKHFSR